MLPPKSALLLMLPTSLPLPPPSGSSALSPKAPFSPLVPSSLAPPCSSDPHWAFRSPALPWCVDPLAPPEASKPRTSPLPVDPSAPPWPLIHQAPLGSLIPPVPFLRRHSLQLHLGLPSPRLHLSPASALQSIGVALGLRLLGSVWVSTTIVSTSVGQAPGYSLAPPSFISTVGLHPDGSVRSHSLAPPAIIPSLPHH